MQTNHEKYYPAGLLIAEKNDKLVKTLELMGEQNVLLIKLTIFNGYHLGLKYSSNYKLVKSFLWCYQH